MKLINQFNRLNKNKDICLWGGHLLKESIPYLRNMKIVGVVDKNSDTLPEYVYGYKVFAVKNALQMDPEHTVFLITCIYVNDVEVWLREHGFK